MKLCNAARSRVRSRLGRVVSFYSIWITVFLTSSTSWAVPTRTEVYRDDSIGLVVYTDSDDASVFWYLPILRVLRKDGQLNLRKTPLDKTPEGETRLSFYVVPELPEDLARTLVREIPGLKNRRQLRPVIAKKISVLIPSFSVVSDSPEVTNLLYINQPQLIRFTVVNRQLREFDSYFQDQPGVPAYFVLSYTGEKRSKYLEIQLSCKDVAKALNVGVSGRYLFARADIENGVLKAISTKSMTVKSKGEIDTTEVMSSIVQECFSPYSRDSIELWRNRSQMDGVDQDDDYRRSISGLLPADEEEVVRKKNLEIDLFEQFSVAQEPVQTPVTGKLVFRRDKVNTDKVVAYKHEDFADNEETFAKAFYLSTQEQPLAVRTVTPLKQRQLTVKSEATKAQPYHTGILVSPGDQWSVVATFSLMASSSYNTSRAYYRWDPNWLSPEGDLYYRIGDAGTWVSVQGQTQMGIDLIEAGELQFYIDREAIWNKLPEKYRKSSVLGMVPAIFKLNRFFPEFRVQLTGQRVSLDRQ